MGCCSSHEAPSFLVQIYVCPLLPSNNISWVGVGGMCLLIRSSQEREHPSELSPPPPSRGGAVQQLPRPSTHPCFFEQHHVAPGSVAQNIGLELCFHSEGLASKEKAWYCDSEGPGAGGQMPRDVPLLQGVCVGAPPRWQDSL